MEWRTRKGAFEIVFSKHAFDRALERRIHPDIVEDTIQTGKMKAFGKNNIRFEKRFKKCTVSCVDERIGKTVKIVTIEAKWKK
ncbi:MAG: DUF4258 domain-containing protein [Candidatus Diapherotrites archaeon]